MFSVVIGVNDVTPNLDVRDTPPTIVQNSLLIPVLTLNLFNRLSDAVAIAEPKAFDEVAVVVRDVNVFGGVITSVLPKRLSKTVLLYQITAVGYHRTLEYVETFRDNFASATVGSIIRNLIGKYAPWITATTANVQDGPILSQLSVRGRNLTELFSELAQDAGFIFFVDENKNAIFKPREQHASSLLVTDAATTYIPDSLEVIPDFSRVTNVVKVIGGPQKGIPVTETFSGAALLANFSLEFKPFGIDRASLLFDDFGGTTFSTLWSESDVSNPSPPPNHVAADGYIFSEFNRIQVVGGNGSFGAVALISVETYQRKHHREFSCEEVFITAVSEGVVGALMDGLGSSTTNVIGGILFKADGDLAFQNGAAVVEFMNYKDNDGNVIAVNPTFQINQTYSIMVQTYLTGAETGTIPWGTKYFIQGGTSPNYGAVSGRLWSELHDVQVVSDPQQFVAFSAIISKSAQYTIRRVSIKDAVPVTLTVGGVSKHVGVETDTGAKTDAFIDINSVPNRLRFFTDTIPAIGSNNISLTYDKTQETVIRRRDSASIARIKGLSSLANDTGERHTTISPPFVAKSVDDLVRIARNYLAEFSQEKYTGRLTTFTPLLTLDNDPPLVGQTLNLNLPSQNIGPLDVIISQITSTLVSTNYTDIGVITSPVLQYDIEFADVDSYQDFITKNQQDLKFINKEADSSQFFDVWDLSCLLTLSGSLTDQKFPASNAEVGTAEVGLSNVGENIT